MVDHLVLATDSGVAVCKRDGGQWRIASRGLDGRQVTSVVAREGVILAATRDGVLSSEDGGDTWEEAGEGLSIRYVRWLAYHPDISDFELAGTEPAAVFISRDGAATWQERSDVAALRDRCGWSLPYSPEAGCIRGFAVNGERIYAAAEVGGMLRSDDQGDSWQLVNGRPAARLHPDVHSVVCHPSSPDFVVAPTGGGLYCSRDGGESWERIAPPCYCRAAWLDPHNPDRIVFGPAASVDRGGRIAVTDDGGNSWRYCDEGLGAPWPRTMVERFVAYDAELVAVRSDGQVLLAPTGTLQWQRILEDAGRVNAAWPVDALVQQP